MRRLTIKWRLSTPQPLLSGTLAVALEGGGLQDLIDAVGSLKQRHIPLKDVLQYLEALGAEDSHVEYEHLVTSDLSRVL